DDDLRRGLPTCHIKFGEANAILAGDALQTLAFASSAIIAIRSRSATSGIGASLIMANASGIAGMCGGQALDLAAEGQRITLDALERI
ncbi:geranyl transferase, partial [Salmonella enterica subsp. enterica serovar Typhimurium]